MFFDLIARNSKRSRKENGLFFCDASGLGYSVLYYTFSFTAGCYALPAGNGK